MKRFYFYLWCLCILWIAIEIPIGTASTDLPNINEANWLILGPLDNPQESNNWDECQGYNLDYLQELGGEENARPKRGQLTAGKAWSSVQAKDGFVNLVRVFGAVSNCVAYGHLEFYSPSEQTVGLRLGSDDGIKVWCNGRLVLNHHIHRALYKDDEAIRINLRAGINRLLIKVDQGTGDWGFAARMVSIKEEEERFKAYARDMSSIRLEIYSAGYVVLPSESIICTVVTKPAVAIKEEISLILTDAEGKVLVEKGGFIGEPIELSLPRGFNGVGLIEAFGNKRLQGKSGKSAVLVGDLEKINRSQIDQARSLACEISKDKTLSDPVKNRISATFNYWANQLGGDMDLSLTTKEKSIQAIQNMVGLSRPVKEHLKGGKTYRVGMLNGVRQWAYQSKIDGSFQPYSMYVPKNYNPERKYSLVVCLHGYSGDDFGAVKQLLGEYRPEDFIVLAPFGRGDLGYRSIGEVDVLDVMKEVEKLYNIDRDRIYLTGWSMGGLGTWRIGQFFAHRFAGIAPFSGWTGTTFLTNMRNLPTLVVHGNADRVVPIYWDQMAVESLKDYGAPVIYHELPGVGHNAWSEWTKDEGSKRLFAYFRQQKRNPWPKNVSFSINHLRYGQHYWVEVSELTVPLKLGHLEAVIIDSNHIMVKTNNVKEFTLNLKHPDLDKKGHLTVNINNQHLRIEAGKDDVYFHLDEENNLFIDSEIPNMRTVKNEGGGLSDLFTRPLYIVYGTRQKEKTASLKSMAETLADWSANRNIGIGTKVGRFRVKADIEVTDEDIKSSTLLLLGSPEENKVIARVKDELPNKWVTDGIQVNGEVYPGAGLILVYPNPLAPQNLMGVISLPFSRVDNVRLMQQLNLALRAYGVRGEDTASVTTPDIMVFGAPGRIIFTGCYDAYWKELIKIR